MTAPDPRLDEIQARLSAATPGPWETTQAADEETTTWIEAANGDVLHHDERGYGHMRENFAWMKRADAAFIANAPGDLAYLLAELRKAREALARVEGLHQPRQFNPISDGVYFGQSEFNHNICAYDHEYWPCPTAAAVAAAKGDERD
jgi:hypothetical protein